MIRFINSNKFMALMLHEVDFPFAINKILRVALSPLQI